MNPRKCYYSDCCSYTDEEFNHCFEYPDIQECPSHKNPMIKKVNELIERTKIERKERYE